MEKCPRFGHAKDSHFRAIGNANPEQMRTRSTGRETVRSPRKAVPCTALHDTGVRDGVSYRHDDIIVLHVLRHGTKL